MNTFIPRYALPLARLRGAWAPSGPPTHDLRQGQTPFSSRPTIRSVMMSYTVDLLSVFMGSLFRCPGPCANTVAAVWFTPQRPARALAAVWVWPSGRSLGPPASGGPEERSEAARQRLNCGACAGFGLFDLGARFLPSGFYFCFSVGNDSTRSGVGFSFESYALIHCLARIVVDK